MFKLFKKSKKPNVNLGKVNYNPIVKRKVVNKDNKQLKVVKLNGKTQYYSAYLDSKNSKLLQMSPLGKKLYKKYPEITNFIYKTIFPLNKLENHVLNNERLNLNLKKFDNPGSNNYGSYKLNAFFKKENVNKDFFVKVTNEYFLANNEFVANQGFEKYGFNVIKPHLAFTDKSKKNSVIIYDFTNLNTLADAYSNKIITNKEYRTIKSKIKKLYKDKNLPTAKGYKKKGIGDFDRNTNIFIKKENEEIKLYFTDLLVGRPYRSY